MLESRVLWDLLRCSWLLDVLWGPLEIFYGSVPSKRDENLRTEAATRLSAPKIRGRSVRD